MQEINVETITSLFQLHYGLLLGVARRYAPAPDLVHDIVQQAFVDFVDDALKGKRDFSRDISPLLYRIVKNRAIKHWAERRKNMPETLQKIAQRLSADANDDVPEHWQDEVRYLEECVRSLPESSRRLIEQHYRQGISMEEMARRGRRNPAAVRQAICRIRLRLKGCIEKKRNRNDDFSAGFDMENTPKERS